MMPPSAQGRGLLWRAILAFLALPGTVGYAMPIIIGSLNDRSAWLFGALPLGAGTVLLIWCVAEFYRADRGTLAPWAPPRDLVVTGPYTLSRNPMYVAVFLVILGWTLWFRSTGLAIYLAIVTMAFYFRVTLHEEPRMAELFPTEWSGYSRNVRRWL